MNATNPQLGDLRLEVDPSRCIGAGNCTEIAGSYFDQDPDEATVILLRSDLDPNDRAMIDEVVSACPVSAISLRGGLG